MDYYSTVKPKIKGKLLFLTQFGSHVYGTNTPNSDIDLKGVYVPSAEKILLGDYPDTINLNTNTDNTKNSKDDIDIEIFSLRKYMSLLRQGQTVALDMLFTPENFWKHSTVEWSYIVGKRLNLITSDCSAFVGYCRTQANKYGIKGSRMGSLEKVLEILKGLNSSRHLEHYPEAIEAICKLDHCIPVTLQISSKDARTTPGIDVLNRKFSVKTEISYMIGVLESIYAKYGERATLAKNNEGLDWKALMHAVRVLNEAKELVQNGNIIFPRPEKEFLLNIRTGKVDFETVSNYIEIGMTDLERILEVNKFSSDVLLMQEIIKKAHLLQINLTYRGDK